MISPMRDNELNEFTRSIVDIVDGFNVAAQLLNEDEIDMQLMKMDICQSVMGTINKSLKFRVNVMSDGHIWIIIRCEGAYDDIISIENKLKSQQITHDLLIDNQVKPLVGRFNVIFETPSINKISEVIEVISRVEKEEVVT